MTIDVSMYFIVMGLLGVMIIVGMYLTIPREHHHKSH